MIAAAVKAAFKEIQQQQAQLLIQTLFSASNISWKLAELEFFFSDMSIAWRRQDIVNKKDKTYYQFVHVFTNRIRIVTVIKNTAKMHQNLNICFWKETECWWTIKLNNIIQADLMINSNNIVRWCKALKKNSKSCSIKYFKILQTFVIQLQMFELTKTLLHMLSSLFLQSNNVSKQTWNFHRFCMSESISI